MVSCIRFSLRFIGTGRRGSSSEAKKKPSHLLYLLAVRWVSTAGWPRCTHQEQPWHVGCVAYI